MKTAGQGSHPSEDLGWWAPEVQLNAKLLAINSANMKGPIPCDLRWRGFSADLCGFVWRGAWV